MTQYDAENFGVAIQALGKDVRDLHADLRVLRESVLDLQIQVKELWSFFRQAHLENQ